MIIRYLFVCLLPLIFCLYVTEPTFVINQLGKNNGIEHIRKYSERSCNISTCSIILKLSVSPQDISGKTVVFDYAKAKTRSGEWDEGEVKYREWMPCSEWEAYSIRFSGGNVQKHKAAPGDLNALHSQTYSKTGLATAKIEEEYEMQSVEYELTFSTPTSGTARQVASHGAENEETVDIEFTVK